MVNKRKIQFIDRKQQVRFAISVAFFSLLFPLLFMGLAVSPALSALLLGDDAAGIQPLIGEFLIFCLRYWWLALLSLLFLSMASVLFSHLIFGPMRRFEIVLKQKRENPDEIVVCNLRKGDYFHDFAKLFEEVLNELRGIDYPLQSTAKEEVEPEELEPADLDPVLSDSS
ncbi:MAG: hypothetical protein O6826_00555 [Acidobacteria bacterium]|nr:hypothetical protein [Acidobacteriota bacterium]